MEVVGSDGTKLSILEQNYLYLYIPHPIYIALRELWGLRYGLRKCESLLRKKPKGNFMASGKKIVRVGVCDSLRDASSPQQKRNLLDMLVSEEEKRGW